MTIVDFAYVINWWFVLLLIGTIFLPITFILFSNFFDRGYIFAKILGIITVSYLIFLLGSLQIVPFTQSAIFLVIATLATINIFIFIKVPPSRRWNLLKGSWKLFLFEEFLFIIALITWSFIRAHEPSIHGLEKYMDFGFMNSILRADFFPPKDMWYAPLPINYYYFGHLVTAVLTKLSGIPSIITYNLMIATLFAFTFTGAFSIGANLFFKSTFTSEEPIRSPRRWRLATPPRWIICALLTAFLVTFAGNLHTIYSFFKPYVPESPVPFWQLAASFETFPNGYWYPNATRFITNTIHEFPLYSFVVSDLHGHVLDIPIVLLTIAVLISIIQNSKFKMQNDNSKIKNLLEIGNWKVSALRVEIPLLSFLLAVMYMTNVWDAAIYASLTFLVFTYLAYRSKNYLLFTIYYLLLIALTIIIALPFSLHFKPFVAGIGIICALEFLTNIGTLGPFIFEPNHCQRSPIWQLAILYGFFYFWVVLFLFRIFNFGHWKLFRNLKLEIRNLSTSDVFVILLILISTLLILTPEIVYAKDIYPAHYRANTMFKLGYQAFIMLSIVSSYLIVRLIFNHKYQILKIKNQNYISNIKKFLNFNLSFCILMFAFLFFILVSIYSFFATGSYYGDLKTYRGLDGLTYLKSLYPTDYEAILWLNKNVKGQPVILEANGDSYTDYDRVSANTGLPTVIGWPVHEWLWRGSYDVASPRITDVQTLYETADLSTAKTLLKKYNVELVFLGDLERQKYPNLSEVKFGQLGKLVYQNGQTRIYEINPGIL